MSNTAIRCAAEELKERVDQGDNELGRDPEVLEVRAQIGEILDDLYRLLEKLHAPQEELMKIKILDDKIIELESRDVLAVARAGMDRAEIAANLGLMCGLSGSDIEDEEGY